MIPGARSLLLSLLISSSGCQLLFAYSPERAGDLDGGSAADSIVDSIEPPRDLKAPDAAEPDLPDAPAMVIPIPIELPDALRWQWEHPSSFGEGLATVWVEDQQVHVGTLPAMSRVLRFADGAWDLVDGRLPKINDIWASGPELLAATSDGVWRHGDSAWQVELDDRSVLGLTGEQDTPVRFALTTDRVHQHDGVDWSEGVDLIPDHGRGDVWCCHEGAAYLVGEHAAVLRWDGAWETQDSSPCETLHAVWVAGSGDVFAVGAQGCAARREPTSGAWEALPTATTSSLEGVWGTGAGEVFAVGAGVFVRLDASGWEPVADAPQVMWRALAGDGENLVAVADDGTIGQYHDGRWRFGAPERAHTYALYAVWSDGTTVLAGGHEGIMRREAAGWVKDPFSDAVSELWGSASGQIFAVGSQGTWRFDGTDWTQQNSADLVAAHGCSATEVYAGGQSQIIRFDGSSWDADWSGTGRVEALWCVEGNVYAGLFDGRVLRRMAANQWDTVYTFPVMIWDIWASSPGDVWVVGHQNQVAHWDGTSWDAIPIDGGETWWSAISGTGSDNVVLVGPGGSVFHYDGNPTYSFSRETSTTGQILRGVCADPSGALYAVGDRAVILRRSP